MSNNSRSKGFIEIISMIVIGHACILYVMAWSVDAMIFENVTESKMRKIIELNS